MKLYLVHCGYYDKAVCEGLYESHANFFVAAEDVEPARRAAKKVTIFQEKKMHIDGLQEIQTVDGFRLSLEPIFVGEASSVLINYNFRELAPKPSIL